MRLALDACLQRERPDSRRRVGSNVDQVQTRSLCIDPLQYLEVANARGAGGKPIGIGKLLAELQAARPGLTIGNFARGMSERRER